MSKEARSKGACWTCKLRRKKCSEEAPVCSACTSLALPCFGYNLPSWADGGELQKAKAEELQVIIRELGVLRRRGRKKQTVAQVAGLKDIETGLEELSQSTLIRGSPKSKQLEPVRDKVINGQVSEASCQSLIVYANLMALETGSSSQKQALNVDFLEYDTQANLLMHYLDVVFPSQFPFYNPISSDGGRGWLLLIVLRTKPLYHAALSMSAYHQRLQKREVVLPRLYHNCAVTILQTHHYLAINELRNHLESFRQEERAQSLEGNIEVLGCIVFLIILETESWPIHLNATQSLLPGLKKGCSKSLDRNEPLSPSHKKAHRFFAGIVSWFAVLSASTTGIKTWTPRMCLDEKTGIVNLETIIGCENSVIVSILDTVELKEWKEVSQKGGNFSASEFVDRATDIERSLLQTLDQVNGIQERAAVLDSLKRNDELRNLALVEDRCRSKTSAITRIFAYAALVYINVVIYGPLADHPKIQERVSQTATAFEELQNPSAMGMLAWPFCIAGCMATGKQMESFRQITLDFDSVSDLKSGNLKRSFLVVEECWRLRRDTAEAADWQRAMKKLNMNILLI